MNIFYEINKDLLNNYEKQNRNYQSLLNIKEIKTNNEIFKKIRDINQNINNKDKLFNLIDFYNKLSSDNTIIKNQKDIEKEIKKENNNKKYIIPKKQEINSKCLNSMTIRYKTNDYDFELRLFGDEFVKNNKNNCVIIIDGKRQELITLLDINENMRKKGYLEIQLKEINTITNLSHMFCGNGMSVINIFDIDKWDTKHVTDMSYLFCCCEELETLPDISSWNTSNVEDMSNMISYCYKIESLPDISKWDTKKVKNMSHMFTGNSALKKLPDISKWHTAKVENMEHMFAYSGITELPDISKWDLSSIKNMSYMFSFCRALKTYPNIFKWKLKNPTNLKGMFYNCDSAFGLEKYDMSNWVINNQSDVSLIFYYVHTDDLVEIIWKMNEKFNIGVQYINAWNNNYK